MSLFKFSFNKSTIFLFLLLICGPAYSVFDDMQCLTTDFEASISHKGSPFGLLDIVLDIKKDGCVITVEHKKFMFVKKKWVIDICRGPVHIKYGTRTFDVHKRKSDCSMENENSDYCSYLESLKHSLENDGLIFAEGEKEDLSKDHGEVFCSFLLIRAYLVKGIIFNRHSTYDDFLDRKIHPSSPHAPGNQLRDCRERLDRTTQELTSLKKAMNVNPQNESVQTVEKTSSTIIDTDAGKIEDDSDSNSDSDSDSDSDSGEF